MGTNTGTSATHPGQPATEVTLGLPRVLGGLGWATASARWPLAPAAPPRRPRFLSSPRGFPWLPGFRAGEHDHVYLHFSADQRRRRNASHAVHAISTRSRGGRISGDRNQATVRQGGTIQKVDKFYTLTVCAGYVGTRGLQDPGVSPCGSCASVRKNSSGFGRKRS